MACTTSPACRLALAEAKVVDARLMPVNASRASQACRTSWQTHARLPCMPWSACRTLATSLSRALLSMEQVSWTARQKEATSSSLVCIMPSRCFFPRPSSVSCMKLLMASTASMRAQYCRSRTAFSSSKRPSRPTVSSLCSATISCTTVLSAFWSLNLSKSIFRSLHRLSISSDAAALHCATLLEISCLNLSCTAKSDVCQFACWLSVKRSINCSEDKLLAAPGLTPG
mmetsp:Transcript_41910/g.76158  ORF Transcript_41910/g.76158 Transcript_41910/m.76158 type:complete len:228 (+) Transcript_41910:877-1560(+)